MRNFSYEYFYFNSREKLDSFFWKIRGDKEEIFMYDVCESPIKYLPNGNISVELDIFMLYKKADVEFVYTTAKQYDGIAIDEYLLNLVR
jgi:hypothetical protein